MIKGVFTPAITIAIAIAWMITIVSAEWMRMAITKLDTKSFNHGIPILQYKKS